VVPLFLLDSTTSMSNTVSASDGRLRKDLLKGLISLLAADKNELRLVSFSGGLAKNIGKLKPDTVAPAMDSIVWRGDTQIVPGWLQLVEVFRSEFDASYVRPLSARAADDSSDSDQDGAVKAPGPVPRPVVVIISDGAAKDLEQFLVYLESNPKVQVLVALIGDSAHPQDGDVYTYAHEEYTALAQSLKNLQFLPFSGAATSEEIARQILERLR
jgi:hypothetical protein